MPIAHALLASLMLSPSTTTDIKNNNSALCCDTYYPERVEAKHIESKGIGYKEGYSTLEGFFTIPSTLEKNWVPFLDIRAHVFNDGRPAVNAGIGLRHLASWVVGANLYYDYRKTSRFHYNQVGAGLEALGRIWNFRINGYFPVGKKESKPYNFEFGGFKGNSLIIENQKEFAMTRGIAELAPHPFNHNTFDT